MRRHPCLARPPPWSSSRSSFDEQLIESYGLRSLDGRHDALNDTLFFALDQLNPKPGLIRSPAPTDGLERILVIPESDHLCFIPWARGVARDHRQPCTFQLDQVVSCPDSEAYRQTVSRSRSQNDTRAIIEHDTLHPVYPGDAQVEIICTCEPCGPGLAF